MPECAFVINFWVKCLSGRKLFCSTKTEISLLPFFHKQRDTINGIPKRISFGFLQAEDKYKSMYVEI